MYAYYPDRPYIYLREPVAQLERNASSERYANSRAIEQL